MSEQNSPIKVDEDVSNIMVVEPDNYRKTQKLKAIQDAKDHFRELKRDHHQRLGELDGWKDSEKTYRKELTTAVLDYYSELIPLVEEGLEAGTLHREDVMITTSREERKLPLRGIARYQGRIKQPDGSGKYMAVRDCAKVYRQAERIERKLGLGLDIQEDKGPAEI